MIPGINVCTAAVLVDTLLFSCKNEFLLGSILVLKEKICLKFSWLETAIICKS